MANSHPWRNHSLGYYLARPCLMALLPSQSEKLVHRFIINQLIRHLTNYLLTRLQTQTCFPKYRSHKISQEWQKKKIIYLYFSNIIFLRMLYSRRAIIRPPKINKNPTLKQSKVSINVSPVGFNIKRTKL